jgi:hypothetical protein
MSEPTPQSTPFTLRGHWNLPGSEEKTAGDLIYDVDRLRLVLLGGFNKAISEHPLSARPGQNDFPVIHGTLVDKTLVTIFRCFYTSYSPDLDWKNSSYPKEVQISQSELNCEIAILGKHLETEDDAFVSARLEFPQLEDWLGASPFEVKIEENRNVDIKFRPPNDECFTTRDFNLSLRHSVRPPSLPYGNRPSAEHTSFLEINPFKSETIKWFVSVNRELTGLFSHLYGGNILSEQFLLRQRVSDDYLAVYYARHRTEFKSIERFNLWTTYEKVKSNFPSLLNEWLLANDSYKQARSMLLSSERRPSAFIELRFLPLVHALEVITQANASTTIVSKEEYTRIKSLVEKAIPTGTHPDLILAFKRSLGHANGKSLKFKIKKLIETISPKVISLLCNDVEKFTKGIVDTRNFYTHYSNQKVILDHRELHWATRKLSVLLRVLSLRSAGMDEDLIMHVLERNPEIVNERRTWQRISENGTGEGIIRSDD